MNRCTPFLLLLLAFLPAHAGALAAGQPADSTTLQEEVDSSSPNADTTMKFIARNDTAQGVDVSFRIEGFESDDGSVLIALYNDEDAFPGDTSGAVFGADVAISGDVVEHTFENVPPGQYAMIYFHDEDGDKELDFNWLHIPKEGYGMSRRKPGGIPDWDDAVFEVTDQPFRMVLQVKYY